MLKSLVHEIVREIGREIDGYGYGVKVRNHVSGRWGKNRNEIFYALQMLTFCRADPEPGLC